MVTGYRGFVPVRESAVPVRSLDQFKAHAGIHLAAFVAELDAAYAEFLERTRDMAPRLETGTKAGIVRDLAARRMREFCDRTKGAEFIRKGNLGVVGLENNWIVRLKKVANGFKVAVSPTGASAAYNRNEVPVSLDGALLPVPPATCLYLGWAVPENAPHRIQKYIICNNGFGAVDWVLPLDEYSPPPAETLPFDKPIEPEPGERRVRVRADRKRKANE
jgi:hypothetical protein